MDQQDLNKCMRVCEALKSEKYKKYNQLFIDPFPIESVPGYLDVVSKKLDITTLQRNLEAGHYKSRKEFFDDASLIFQNAIKYHGTRETKWITKPAKEMLKVVQKELKNMDKRPSKILQKQKAGSLKLKMGGIKKKEAIGSKTPPSGISPTEGTGRETPTNAPEAETAPAAAPAANPNKPKVSLKLKTGASKIKEKANVPVKAKPTQAKPAQPKLKLKISLSKKPTDGAPTAQKPPPPTEEATPKSTTTSSNQQASSSKSDKPPKTQQIRLGGPRGKELPKGVTPPAAPPPKKSTSTTKTAKPSKPLNTTPKATAVAATATAKTTVPKTAATGTTATGKTSTTKTTKKTGTKKGTTKKVKKAAAAAAASAAASVPSTPAPAPSTGTGGVAMTPQRKIQCSKVISGLKRRKQKSINWFLLPVSDKNIIADYRAKIKHPMCISTMQNKLDKNEYSTVGQFVLDLRRIFANCLRFNTSMKDRLRPLAVDLLGAAEDLLVAFLVRGPKTGASTQELYPPLLYCWSFCIKVLNTLFNLTNPSDGQPTVLYFLHPVTVYCGGQYPPDYLNLVKKPMDFGTITTSLIEGQYKEVDEFASDCRLVIENCRAYYGGREDGRIFIEQAEQLGKVLNQQLDAFDRYLKSGPGVELKAKAAAKMSPTGPPLFPKPPVPLLMSILEDLRACKYTDKGTKITEPAMGPFEKPVSVEDYPDYPRIVQTPIDLQQIEKKTKAGVYEMPEDFEWDMSLMFKNCETYNSHRQGDHLVAMAKYGAKQFRRLFSLRMRSFEDPTSVTAKEEEQAVTSSINPNKKIKVETAGGVSKGKAAPRISFTAAQISSATAQSAKPAKIPSTAPTSNKNRAQPVKANQPVPLHIAIARVKEAYPLRRAHKSLQTWEADCARFFKELMRHPWISAARPKFIFHVPVPVLFPELKEAYMMKIKKPMDLTTVECNLLEGNRYTSADDFVQDVSLVFSNAITFNKDGRDVGDPLSCAYYDASIHLLRYSRWLSLELLANHVADIDAVDEDGEGDDKLPPLSWRLTAGNRKKARSEMEALVLNEPIEKSVEGDRFTWMEAECEKLLKALRHQSDLRQMTFFIAPNYPPDYAAFISKPMDWEKVQRTLKQREYDTFGEIISDLRLIFTNALKYNARLKGTATVSGRAYDAAIYMSGKLEAAINKMLLSVSDRLERERIDHANAEREIEAAEQAEEARIRATWKKDATPEEAASGTPAATSTSTVKIRAVRKATKKKESTDFEIPFFDDEDDGQHERSYFDAVKQQKALFERQRQDLAKMRQAAMTTGSGVFARLLQREKAKRWLSAMEMVSKKNSPKNKQTESESKTNNTGGGPAGTSVLSELEKEGRNPVKISFVKKMKKRKRPAIDFD